MRPMSLILIACMAIGFIAPANAQDAGPQAERPAPAASATTQTPADTATCTTESLRADGVTEAQARNEVAGTMVSIRGVPTALPDGGSRWSLCSGPTLEQRLATAEAELATVQGQLIAAQNENGQLKELAYVNGQDGQTWRDFVADLQTNNAELRPASVWAKIWFGVAVVLGMVMIWALLTRNPRRKAPIDMMPRAEEPRGPIVHGPEPVGDRP